jgi:predicted RNase H-like nuclease (RuvC/YqgF family)
LVKVAEKGKKELDDLNTLKDLLRLEFDDSVLNCSRIRVDYISLMSKHENLSRDFSFYKEQQNKNSQEEEESRLQGIEYSVLCEKLLVKNEEITLLQTQLASCKERNAELKLLPAALKQSNEIWNQSDDDNRGLKFDITQLNGEVKAMKKVIETLKDKIRDMSGKDSAFMDSFEEVFYLSIYL